MSVGAAGASATTALPLYDDLSVLETWKRGFAHGSRRRQAEVRRALAGLVLIEDRQWDAAACGDPSAAIGVAIHHLVLVERLPSKARIDLIMSALWLSARRGDQAAQLVFGMISERILRVPARTQMDDSVKPP